MTRIRTLKHALFALPVAGAMLFGASQVFASPVARTSEAVCHEELCQQWCGGPAFCEGGRTCICI